MRINIGSVGLDPLQATVELVELAERCGLDGVVSSEHLGFHDAIVPSALYLQKTSQMEVSMVGLNEISRHPGLLAMELASLSEIGAGRVRAQVGTGAADLVAQIGGSKERPIPRVRSLVSALRALLNGESLSSESPAGVFDGFGLKSVNGSKVVPFSGHPVPLDIMAVQPAMLRLAAEVADGAALSGGCSADYIKDAVKYLEEELEKAGRQRNQFRVTAFAYCVVDPNATEMVENIRYMLGNYDPKGAAKLMRGVLDGTAYIEAAAKDRDRAVREFLTTDVLEQVAIIASDVNDVRTALKRYSDAGVDALCVHLVGPLATRPFAIKCLAEARQAL